MNGNGAFLVVTAIFTIALTILRAFSLDALTRWLIPGFELVVLARAILPVKPWNSLRAHLVCGLTFCLLGDLLVNWTSLGKACILFFSVTHLNLLWIFIHLRRPKLADLPAILPWCFVSLVVFGMVSASLRTWMFPAMAAYLLLLDLMAWRAFALLPAPRSGGALLLALGGGLFFATDHLVILQFLRPREAWVIATWICYPPALALLALSSRPLGIAATSKCQQH